MAKIIIEIDDKTSKILNKAYHSYTDIHDTLAYPLYSAVTEGTPLNTLKSELLKHGFTRKAEEGNIFVKEYYMIEKSEFDRVFDKVGDTDGNS